MSTRFLRLVAAEDPRLGNGGVCYFEGVPGSRGVCHLPPNQTVWNVEFHSGEQSRLCTLSRVQPASVFNVRHVQEDLQHHQERVQKLINNPVQLPDLDEFLREISESAAICHTHTSTLQAAEQKLDTRVEVILTTSQDRTVLTDGTILRVVIRQEDEQNEQKNNHADNNIFAIPIERSILKAATFQLSVVTTDGDILCLNFNQYAITSQTKIASLSKYRGIEKCRVVWPSEDPAVLCTLYVTPSGSMDRCLVMKVEPNGRVTRVANPRHCGPLQYNLGLGVIIGQHDGILVTYRSVNLWTVYANSTKFEECDIDRNYFVDTGTWVGFRKDAIYGFNVTEYGDMGSTRKDVMVNVAQTNWLDIKCGGTPPPWNHLKSMTTACTTTEIFVFGGVEVGDGRGAEKVVNTIWKFQPASCVWTTCAPMPVACHSASVAGAGDYLIFSGGVDESNSTLTTIYVSDAKRDDWSFVGHSDIPLRNHLTGAVIVDS